MLMISGLGANRSPTAPTAVSSAIAQMTPASMITTTAVAPQTCDFGFSLINGVCMSEGCISGKSLCAVADIYGQTCSYDQMLAYASKTGSMTCGPSPIDQAAIDAAKAQAAADAAAAQAALDAAAAQAAAAIAAQQQQAQQATQDAQTQQAVAQGTAPSPGMQVDYQADYQQPQAAYQAPINYKPWLMVGAGVLGLGVLVALLRR